MTIEANRPKLFRVLGLRVLLSAWTATAGHAATVPALEPLFERHEIVTGSAQHQLVLTGSLLDGSIADLAVIQSDEGEDGRLRIYGYRDDGWAPKVDATLRPGVLLVDVASIGGRDRLITYEEGRLNWFDAESATERELMAVRLDYTAPPGGAIFFADLTRDLNADGRDDLVIPGRDGFALFIQRSDGTFTEPMRLGYPEPYLDESAMLDDYTYGEMGLNPISIPWYLGRVHLMDYNRDGRDDLVFWSRDHFEAHLQDERGSFSSEPRAFTTDVALDSDGEYSLQYGFSTKYSRQKALHSFSDLNGDGVADMVTMTLEGQGMLGKHTTFDVHFGAPAPGGLRFSRDADTSIRSESISRGLRQHDLDNDGRMDLKVSTMRLSFFRLVRAYLANSFSWEIEFFRMEDGIYPEEPNTTRRLKGDLRGKNAYSPPVLIGDVNGDRRADLLFGKSREELLVYLGVPGPELFSKEAREVAVDTPPDDESSIDVPYRRSRLVDLNRDGRQDLLIDDGFAKEPRRVTILVAR